VPTLNTLREQPCCLASTVMCLANTTKKSLVETNNSTLPASWLSLSNRSCIYALFFSLIKQINYIHIDRLRCVLINLIKKWQMDYLLGSNPEDRSYMVGYGKSPPTQAHHRGASVPILSKEETVSCSMSFVNWFTKNGPNPNELTGAIVGGPDRNDNFDDKRWDSSKTEPCTYINSLAVGPLAKLASHSA
jgi:hypothetical protein